MFHQISGRIDNNNSTIYLLEEQPIFEFRIGGETAIRFGKGADIEAMHKKLTDGGR